MSREFPYNSLFGDFDFYYYILLEVLQLLSLWLLKVKKPPFFKLLLFCYNSRELQRFILIWWFAVGMNY